MASSGAVRAGRAFVELFADDSLLRRNLDAAAARVAGWASKVQGVAIRAGAAGGIVTAPLTKALVDAASRGRDVDQLAKQFGITTESVSALAFAFESVRVPFDEFAGSMEGLSGKIKAAADSNSELVAGLAGLNGRALINKDIGQTLELLADRISGIRLPIDQARVAEELFGSAGLRLLPVLKQGAAGIRALRAEAAAGGYLVSAKEAEQSTALMKAANVVWQELAATVRAVGAELVPATASTDGLTAAVRRAFAQGRDWLKQNRDWLVLIAKVGVTLVATSATLLALAPVLKVVALGFTLVSGSIGLVGAALGLVLTPVGLVVAAVGGLAALFATQTAAGERMTSRIGAGFTEFADTAKRAWGGIVAAFKKGDLAGAFEVAGAGLRLEWAKVVAYWTEKWLNFKGFFEEGWEDATDWLAKKLGALWGGDELERAVTEDAERAKKARADKRRADVDAAKRDADAARARFDALVGDGAGGDGRRGGTGLFASAFTAAIRSVLPEVGAAAAKGPPAAARDWQTDFLPKLFTSAKGTFAGPSGQQLGYADSVPQRQLDAIKGVRDNTQATVDAVVELGKRFVFG